LSRITSTPLVLAWLLLSAGSALAQEDKKKPPADPKKATEDLLQKAEDEYRLFFRRPKTVLEFWAAMKFEIGVGKFDLAALHLKQLLDIMPPEEADKELLKIEEADGLSGFLRLQTVRKWSDFPPFQKEAEKSVGILISRVTGALEKHLSDPQRIRKFIPHLDAATVEERAYAFAQLDRSRARAAPYLVRALQESTATPLHDKIVDALGRFSSDIVPPLLEVLKAQSIKDAQAPELRLTLLSVLKRRGDPRAIPYLWHLSSAPQYPVVVRARAGATLSYLLDTPPDSLPPAKIALTELAEKYYHHRVKFPDPKQVKVWPWNGNSLAAAPVTLTAEQAEEYYGLRYAREALDLDPAYKPAQTVFLNLMLDHNFAPQLDEVFLKKTPGDLRRLLASIDSDLLIRTLERALGENKTRVILALVEALGDRGEVRAARPSVSSAPQGVMRALTYPDRRVQFAAALAMLRMPGATVPVAGDRIVEILRRFVAADPQPKALVAYAPADKAAQTRKTVAAAGFNPLLVATVREAFEQLNRSADFDVMLLFPSVPFGEFPYVLTQFRQDKESGLLPLFILEGKKQENLPRLAARFQNTWVVPDVIATLPEELKATLEKGIKDATGAKLSAKERQELTRTALDILRRMARGEIRGYDVRPAQDAVVQALRSPDLAPQAVEILGRLPGADNQQRLAGIVLDPARAKLRLAAALELNRHIQKHGVLLAKQQVKDLKSAYQNPAENADLRTQLALVIGSLRPSSTQTGGRLIQFQFSGKE
jgi:hypothetical protein